MNIFEYATRNKLRFPYRGSISVEDLWDLSTKDLDNIFKTLNSQLKTSNEESLLETKSKEDEVLGVQIEIIKHIVKTKLEDIEKAKKARENKEKRQQILQIMANKQNAALEDMSLEDLQKLLDQMEG